MAPKPRKKDKHLPQRVYLKHRSYYYVLNNKWIFLGKTLPEAMKHWAELADPNETDVKTMRQLIDRYMNEIAPGKSPKSYKENIRQAVFLKEFFGDMKPHDITPVGIYKYLDLRKTKAPVAANREKALLSHIFSLAIRWGIVSDNPCRNVKRNPEKPRERYVNEKEFNAFLNYTPEIIKNLMEFAYLTGQRIGDILNIRLTDITEEGIKISQSKGKGKVKLNFTWSKELRSCVEKVKRVPRALHSVTLFCNTYGEPLTYSALRSMWVRSMDKAIEDKIIEKRFTIHDLRAKSSSDEPDLQKASKRLGHSDTKITDRVYNRNYKNVTPLK